MLFFSKPIEIDPSFIRKTVHIENVSQKNKIVKIYHFTQTSRSSHPKQPVGTREKNPRKSYGGEKMTDEIGLKERQETVPA